MALSGVLHFCQRLLNMIISIARASLQLRLVNFFGLSFVFYGIATLVTMMWSAETHTHLCTIPPHVNLTAVPVRGMSCANCSANLAICPKVQAGQPEANCYQRAINTTWKRFASTNRDAYFDDFMEASMSRECYKSVTTASDPVAMVRSISRQPHGANPDSQIVPGCKMFHCKVMLEATKDNTDLSNIASPDGNGCTQRWGVKEAWDETYCPCNVIKNLPFSTAARLQAYCGDSAANFSLHMLWKTLYSFEDCYTQSIFQATQAFAEDWRLLLAAATESVASTAPATDEEICVEYIEGATAAWDFFGDVRAANQIASSLNQYGIPERCKIIMCYALNRTLFVDDCHWIDDPFLITVDTDSIKFAASQCSSFYNIFADHATADALMARTQICERYEDAAIRIEKEALGFCPPLGQPLPGAPPGGPPGGGAAGRRLLNKTEFARNTLVQLRVKGTGSEARPSEAVPPLEEANEAASDHAVPTPAGIAAAELMELQASDSLRARRAQDETATAAPSSASGGANADLPPWETSPWGDCHCYQQCIPGYRRRTVVCPAPPCMAPRPKWVASCVCNHCAKCDPALPFFVAMCAFGAQAALSLCTFLAFAKIESFVEDDLASVGYIDKIVGCFCKMLPTCIKIVMYLSLLSTIYLAFITVFPRLMEGSDFEECKNTPILLQWVIVASGVLVFQITVGIYIKKNRSVAAWLYSPTKPGMMKLVCTPFRAIGP